MHNQLEGNLENADVNFFTEHQHGFRKNHSTTHVALQLFNHINCNLDNQTPTAAVFIDFRKAFDCVCHSSLIDKIKTSNLGPKTIGWVKDYLKNRTQRVLMNNRESGSELIRQGVPQGSILGPLLYIMYANDIPSNIKSKVILYADDTVIFTSSKNKHKVELELQEDLNTLEQWCLRNKLAINVDKTKLMICGSTQSVNTLGEVKIQFGRDDIKPVPTYNYLEIKLDPKLKYDPHAKAIIQLVSNKLVYLRHIRRFINSTAALSIYTSMILPILEYGDVLMVFIAASLKKKLQILQNKALKCALGLDPLSSTEETHKLAKLDKLSSRRKQHVLQLMYKQQTNAFLWKKKSKRHLGATTRSAGKNQFVLRRIKTERFKRSVTNKAPQLWNALPYGIQELPDIHLFKRKLRGHVNNPREVQVGRLTHEPVCAPLPLPAGVQVRGRTRIWTRARARRSVLSALPVAPAQGQTRGQS